MKKIIADYKLSARQTNNLVGKFVDESHIDILIEDDVDIYKPDGKPLLFFRKNYIKSHILKEAYENMIGAAKSTDQRSSASGGERVYKILKDGTKSRTMSSTVSVNSGIAGFFDRNAHYDFCRTTSFTKKNLAKFKKALPLFKAVNDGFKTFVPHAYKLQKEMAEATHPNYVIEDTAFTTITINKNYRAAVHTDAGDFEKGFGNLVAYMKDIEPVYLIFPRYKVGVNLTKNDLLLADVHEHHGNNEIIKKKKSGVRLSFVMYYRKNMIKCLKPSKELKRIQTNKRIIAQKYLGVI